MTAPETTPARMAIQPPSRLTDTFTASGGDSFFYTSGIDNTPNMVLSTTAFEYPGKTLVTNGQKCPSGTPDAGKAGQVEVSYWANTDTKTKAVTVTNPSTLKLGFNSLVTVGFVPKGTVLKRPSQAIITSLLLAGANGASATTTTVPTTTATTSGPTTSTTAASSTSTTAKSSTTSTTKP